MSPKRYTPEFKDEAVRRVIERGYPVAEVAERLGVSTHSLHKWEKRSNRLSPTRTTRSWSRPRVKSASSAPSSIA